MTTFFASFAFVLALCLGVLYAAVAADQMSVRAGSAIAFLMGCFGALGALAFVSDLTLSMAGSGLALTAFIAGYFKYLAEDRGPRLYIGWRSPN